MRLSNLISFSFSVVFLSALSSSHLIQEPTAVSTARHAPFFLSFTTQQRQQQYKLIMTLFSDFTCLISVLPRLSGRGLRYITTVLKRYLERQVLGELGEMYIAMEMLPPIALRRWRRCNLFLSKCKRGVWTRFSGVCTAQHSNHKRSFRFALKQGVCIYCERKVFYSLATLSVLVFGRHVNLFQRQFSFASLQVFFSIRTSRHGFLMKQKNIWAPLLLER